MASALAPVSLYGAGAEQGGSFKYAGSRLLAVMAFFFASTRQDRTLHLKRSSLPLTARSLNSPTIRKGRDTYHSGASRGGEQAGAQKRGNLRAFLFLCS